MISKKMNIKKELLAGIALSLIFMADLAFAGSFDEDFQKIFIIETAERDLNRAVELYEKLARQSKGKPAQVSKVYYRLGLCYEKLGKNLEAMEFYEQAMISGVDSAIETAQKAKMNFERLRVAVEQEQKLKKAETALESIKPKPIPSGQRFRKSLHFLKAFSVGYAADSEFVQSGLGAELYGYEYIHKSGWGLKLVPLNFYYSVSEDSDNGPFIDYVDYAPVWLRYYFRGEKHRTWAFFGVGYDYYSRDRVVRPVNSPLVYFVESKSGNGVGLELGVNFGKSTRWRNGLTLKALPIRSPFEEIHFLLMYDLSIGFERRNIEKPQK